MRRTVRELIVIVLPIWLFAWISIAWRSACFGPTFDELGASVNRNILDGFQRMCPTDIQVMWDQRGLGAHLFPYIFGAYMEPLQLTGGTVEYPVFSGLFMWATGLLAANGLQFLVVSTLSMAVVATLTAVLLYRMVAWWALLWSLAPAMLLYIGYNWDMLPALCTVAGFALAARSDRSSAPQRWQAAAAIAFGVGALFKLYPALFVLPLALWAAHRHSGTGAAKWRRGMLLLVAGVATFVLGNLPFALLGTQGWLASFAFQAHRPITPDTLSLWWLSAAAILGKPAITGAYLPVATAVATACAAFAAGAALLIGWQRRNRLGGYPMIQVSAAMLVGYLTLNKVHSLQYVVWLLPFLVLVAIPTWLVVSYLVLDIVSFGTWFQVMIADVTSSANWWTGGNGLGVIIIVRTALYAALFLAFLRSPLRSESLPAGRLVTVPNHPTEPAPPKLAA